MAGCVSMMASVTSCTLTSPGKYFRVPLGKRFLAKHAARGGQHYQRCAESLPPGWQGQTGRMWGHVGDWPTQEPVGVELDWAGWFMLRRLFRAHKLSQARSLPPGRRGKAISYARRSLRFNAPRAAPGEFQTDGRCRGFSGWIPESVSFRMVEWLSRCGCSVESS